MAGKTGMKWKTHSFRELLWVYEHDDESEDVTTGRRFYRRLLKKDPDKFMARLERMEAAHQASKTEAASQDGTGQGSLSGGSEDVDPGLDALEERVERLLRERAWEKE